MTPEEHQIRWQREGREGTAQVLPIELFFDLVYVLAVTQLTHYLLDHLTARGVAETLLLLLAVWGGWINTVWITNYFDVGKIPVRLMLLGIMFASLLLSGALPEAFNSRGLLFAIALSAVLVGGTAFLLIAIGSRERLSQVLERVLIWWAGVSVLWIAGGVASGDLRFWLWAAAVLISYLVIWFGFPVPGMGHSETSDYTIRGELLAERCQLFIILALGESIVITGTHLRELPLSLETVAAFLVAFLGTVTLWWIYFDRGAEAAAQLMATTPDPGRLGVSAFTYFHIPMVAGIILFAAADELTLAHPNEQVTVVTALVLTGGPLLFLIGNVLYKRALWHHMPTSRLIGIAALLSLAPLSLFGSLLILLAAVTGVLMGVAWSDVRAMRRYDAEHA